MAIEFRCACGKEYKVKDSLAGRRGTCKECGSEIVVPEKSEPEEEDLKASYEALVRKAFRNNRDFYVDHIPKTDLQRARATYAKRMEPSERPVALFRQGILWRLFRNGFLFTDRGIHYRLLNKRGSFRYQDITTCETKVERVSSRHGADHRFLIAEVMLDNGEKHKFAEYMVPFFAMLETALSEGPVPTRDVAEIRPRTAEKKPRETTTVAKLLVIACIVGGIAGLLAHLLIEKGIFKDEKAPYEAAIILFFLTLVFGLADRKKYACGECGQPVGGGDRFCPKCKCFFA